MNELKLKQNLKKITIFFVIISFLIFAFGAVASYSLDQVFKDTMHQQINAQAIQYKNSINKKIQSGLQTLYALNSLISFSEYIQPEVFENALYESNNKLVFFRMVYFDTNGDGIRVTTNGDIEKNVKPEDMNENIQKAIKEAWTGETTISDIYYDEGIEKNVIAYVVPVKKDDKVTGVVAASQSIDTFGKTLDNQGILSDNGIVMLVDKNGEVLTSSTNLLNKNIEDVKDLKSIDDKTKDKIISSISNLKSSNIPLKINGSLCYAIVEPVGIKDWSLVIIDSATGINRSMYQNINITRVTSIISLALAIICIFSGYRQIKKSNDNLLKLAYYDRLTGAYNMEKFNMLLDEMWDKQDKNSAVVAIDIKQFKFVNEIFGEDMANKLLYQIKTIIDKNIHKEDEFFCRENADLFFIFMREAEQQKIVDRVNVLISQIKSIVLSRHQQYPISVCCGMAFTSDFIGEKQQFMTRVMFALNRAKLSGKSNNIKFYDLELHKTEQMQNYIESHMQEALNSGEFKLFLQPKFKLQDGSLYGAEALVRWKTNDDKMIFPDQFIPLFEENGFCTKLDLYMVEKVCKQLRRWIDKGYKPINISVNQSKLLFYKENYVERLCNITRKYNISPSLITLEILEGLALNNVDELNNKIRKLKQKGFKISMDDFGSGYSSLNTLGNIDIDELKLDKSFLMIASNTNGHRQRLIMEQIIVLAKKMNMYTVAEGVETKENEQMIKELGCDFGQGYYYSRPISAKEFGEKYMKERKKHE